MGREPKYKKDDKPRRGALDQTTSKKVKTVARPGRKGALLSGNVRKS